jgi:hypothetical protein
MSDLRTTALTALAAGISIIPVSAGTKRPTFSWERFQAERATVHDTTAWFTAPHSQAFAGICGAVSGNLLVIDFDVEGFYEDWLGAVGELSHKCVIQQTGGGCYQVWFRCTSPVGGNEKLAWNPSSNLKDHPTGREIAVETRGEGGYAVMAPSLHPSGKRYELVQGSWDAIPTLPPATTNALLDAARRLCKAPFTKQERERANKAPKPNRPARTDGQSVIEAFNNANALPDVLRSCGYTPAFAGRWNRPGGETAGVILSPDQRRSFHFSSNDPLNDGHQHDAFDVFRLLKHGGDFRAAVSAASADLGMKTGKVAQVATQVRPKIEVKDAGPDGGLKARMEKMISGEARNIPWKQHGPRPRKLTMLARALKNATATLVCGSPGSCKSWFVLEEAFDWHVNDEKPAVKMLEDAKDFHLNRVLAQVSGDERMTHDEWVKANGKEARAIYERHESVITDFATCLDDAQEDATHEDLIRWADRKARDGYQILIIDPVTMAAGKTSTVHIDDKEFLRGLKRIQDQFGVRTILVTHPKGGTPQKGQDPLDLVAGGQAYKRFSQTVLIVNRHRRSPRACRIEHYEPHIGETTRQLWVTRSISIAKARNGKGEGLDLAMEFNDRTLRFEELGVVREELKKGEMMVAPPG